MRINLQNQMQNMHRQIFPLSILDTLFLLGQQVLKILKSLLDVTPTTIHIHRLYCGYFCGRGYKTKAEAISLYCIKDSKARKN